MFRDLASWPNPYVAPLAPPNWKGEAGCGSDDMLRTVELQRVLQNLESGRVETVYLLGLESGPCDPHWSMARRALDLLVRTFQPSPVITHVEILLLHRSTGDQVHFSTYLGHTAGWGSSFPDSKEFYLGRQHTCRWRAIPVQGVKIAELLRRVCKMSEKAPYSLSRYVFSVPPLRAFASVLPDGPCSPAHCAGLAARLLQEASRELALPKSPPWYSPSTIFIELSRPSRMACVSQQVHDSKKSKLPYETAQTLGALETLLRGSDASVAQLQASSCLGAIESLTERVAVQRAGKQEDTAKEAILERQLARALLRFVELSS